MHEYLFGHLHAPAVKMRSKLAGTRTNDRACERARLCRRDINAHPERQSRERPIPARRNEPDKAVPSVPESPSRVEEDDGSRRKRQILSNRTIAGRVGVYDA